MTGRKRAGIAAVVAVVALAALAIGSWLTEPPPAPAPPPPVLDADGDALPPWAICRIGTARFRGAQSFVAFTGDGTQIVHGTTDGFVRVIDRRTGAVVNEFAAQHGDLDAGPPRSLWNELERAFRRNAWRDEILGAAVSTDGSSIATHGFWTTNVYELATGRRIARWHDNSAMWPVAWTPDGGRVVTVDFFAGVYVRDAASGRDLLTARDANPASRGCSGEAAVAVSPTGRLAAAQSYKLRVVDLATGAEVFATEPGDFAGPVAFSPDGAFLLHTRKNEAVVVRDTRTWSAVREIAGSANALAFSRDGAAVALAGEHVRVLDFATGATRAEFPIAAQRIALSADGSALAALVGATVRVFDLARGVEDPPASPPTCTPSQLAWSPDGKRLAIADDAVLRVADATTGRIERSWETGGMQLVLEPFADDGRHAGVVGRDAERKQFWAALLDTTAEGPPERHPLDCVLPFWDPSAHRLRGVIAHEGKLRIVEADDGALVREISDPPSHQQICHDTARSLRVVRGGTDREFDVDDVATGALLAEIVAPAELTDVDDCHLVDGRLVLTDDDLGRIAVFDARTGERQVVIDVKSAHCGRPAISRDGSLVACLDGSNAVRVFDGRSGRELAVMKGHRGWCHAIAFSPDGRRLATSSEDGTILVWDVAAATGR